MQRNKNSIYQRIILKISGESLGNDNENWNLTQLSFVVQQMIEIQQCNVELGVVVGAGNIARGRDLRHMPLHSCDADYIGMVATLLNAIMLKNFLQKYDCPTIIQSATPTFAGIAEPFHRMQALRHMKNGNVVIFAGGIGNPYFTTDMTGVLRTLEMDADILLKATKVDGIYDKDPLFHPEAKKYSSLSHQEYLHANLKIMDPPAISLCKENNVPVIVFNMFQQDNIKKILNGKQVGTQIKLKN